MSKESPRGAGEPAPGLKVGAVVGPALGPEVGAVGQPALGSVASGTEEPAPGLKRTR